MRNYDVKIGGQIRMALTEADIVYFFSRGEIERDTPCRVSGSNDWQDVNEYFPMLKYGCPAPIPVLPVDREVRPTLDLGRDERNKPALTSALKAGWICFALGLAIAWIFPPAFFFYSLALILAVVAMCTHQVNKGLALLLSTFAAMGASALISFFLAIGIFAAAAGTVVVKANQRAEEQRKAQREFIAAQQKTIASLNQSIPRQPGPFSAQRVTPTPIPIQSMSKRQLFDEIARIEKEMRDLRKAGRPIPLSTEDYLERLKTALDAG